MMNFGDGMDDSSAMSPENSLTTPPPFNEQEHALNTNMGFRTSQRIDSESNSSGLGSSRNISLSPSWSSSATVNSSNTSNQQSATHIYEEIDDWFNKITELLQIEVPNFVVHPRYTLLQPAVPAGIYGGNEL